MVKTYCTYLTPSHRILSRLSNKKSVDGGDGSGEKKNFPAAYTRLSNPRGSVRIHEVNNVNTHRFDTRTMSPTFPWLGDTLLLALDTKFTRSRILTSLIILSTAFAPQFYQLWATTHVNTFLRTSHTSRTRTLIVALAYSGLDRREMKWECVPHLFVVSPAICTCQFCSISPVSSRVLQRCGRKFQIGRAHV